ncbi:MAG: ABC transporter ATP-binding protein [Planctomycetota bacterium]
MTDTPSENILPTDDADDRSLFTIEDLAVSFDIGQPERVQAVDGLSLTIHPRQTLALVGESGCGKSVTALSTLQLIPSPPGYIDRGSIALDGRNLLLCSPREMLKVRGREIAMIFQEPMTSLNPVFTVGDQIIETIRRHRHVSRAEARELAIETMQDVGLPDAHTALRTYPHEYSGGMRQRAMIAMALVCQPRVLLADEPTTALDVTIQKQILRLLRELQQERGMAILLITHDLGVVSEAADVACVMYAGRAVEYASVTDLFERPMHPYTRGLLNSIPRLGERRRRLRTVSELVRNPEEFTRLPTANLGVEPWWPRRDEPDGVVPDEQGHRSVLHEIEPGHWVNCWRTPYVAAHLSGRPDLKVRRSTGATSATS